MKKLIAAVVALFIVTVAALAAPFTLTVWAGGRVIHTSFGYPTLLQCTLAGQEIRLNAIRQGYKSVTMTCRTTRH